MATVYEDNFGFWGIDYPEESAFFEHVQSQSHRKICERCKRSVRLIPVKTICAACVSALECGAPASINEYDQPEPNISGRRPIA
jgi:predicted amidophosphoribosyltransferase